MAFDWSNRNPAPGPAPNDPPEWLDFLARLIGMSLFAAGLIGYFSIAMPWHLLWK